MPLRRTDITLTKKFEDGDDWIELRKRMTHGQRLDIAQLNQSYRVEAAALAGLEGADRRIEMEARIAATKRMAFGFLVVGWSLKDDAGKDIEPSLIAYDSLDEESGAWVDECIDAVLGELNQASAEGNGSGPKPKSSAKRSPSAAR